MESLGRLVRFVVVVSAVLAALFVFDRIRTVQVRTSSNPVHAPADTIERIQATGWLSQKFTCNGPRSQMYQQDYLDCILAEAALLPPLDPERRDHFSEGYDPKAYYECRVPKQRNDTGCTPLKIRRSEPEPAWPYPDVPAIQWPEAPDTSVHKWWMSSEQYFDALCETEAGQFIYRTVNDVEGVYQIRPRYKANDDRLSDRYVLEDVYHYDLGGTNNMGDRFVGTNKYKYWESSLYEPSDRWVPWRKKYYDESLFQEPPPDARFIRYEGFDGSRRSIRKHYEVALRSRYGYVWRGIRRPHDRELGIAGGELAVVDLKTNEILGLWRGFFWGGISRVWWLSGLTCPRSRPGDADVAGFVMQVLIPAEHD